MARGVKSAFGGSIIREKRIQKIQIRNCLNEVSFAEFDEFCEIRRRRIMKKADN
jgi:hypothetical protein